MDNYANSVVSDDVFYDEQGYKYSNTPLFLGFTKYITMNGGVGGFNVGDGVACLSDIKVFGYSGHGTKRRTAKPTWIVIHYTAGQTSRQGSAKSCCYAWVKRCSDTPNNPGSADLCVDDVETWQFTPNIDEYSTCHSGGNYKSVYPPKCKGRCYNSNSIGIELCSTLKSGYSINIPNHEGWYFTDAVLRRGIELTRALMRKYNIDKSHICRHYDCSGKLCPGIVGWNPEPGSNDESQWLRFLATL